MATTLSTAASTTLPKVRRASTGDSSAPCALIVLVSPADVLAQCNAAITNTRHAGAKTFTFVVDHAAPLLETLDGILRTVDQASFVHPGVPVVLVGHGDAEDATLLAAEALQGAIAGVVVTRPQDGSGSGERAA